MLKVAKTLAFNKKLNQNILVNLIEQRYYRNHKLKVHKFIKSMDQILLSQN